MNENFLLLVRVAAMSASPDEVPAMTDREWADVFNECRRQALIGVIGDAVGRLPADRRPPMSMWMQWVATVAHIQEQNRRMDENVERLRGLLATAGLDMRVLKGQAAAAYYPQPNLRQSGDIDAWVRPADNRQSARASNGLPTSSSDKQPAQSGGSKPTPSSSCERIVIPLVQALGLGRLTHVTYHHAEWEGLPVNVELHYRPSYFCNPLTDRRFQRWAGAHFDTGQAEFDRVYMLVHVFRHVLSEGVGLRQLMDYAMLLRSHPASTEEKREAVCALRSLGLVPLAKAVMHIMRRVFGLPDSLLLTDPDPRRGERLLREISLSGNFGYFDSRHDLSRLVSESGSFWLHTRRRLRFLTDYPAEVLFDIPFRLWHYFWRRNIRKIIKT